MTEHPMFGSSSSTPHRDKEGTSNLHTLKTFLFRFSSKAIQRQDDLRTSPGQSPTQTLLSHESSVCAESLYFTEDEIGHNSKQNTASTASPSCEFHFSIHKWAGREVPLLMSLRGGKHPTFRESSKVYNVQDTGFPHDNISADRRYTEPHSEIGLSEGIEKDISTAKQEVNKHFVSLRTLLYNEMDEQGDKEVDREAEGKENVDGMTGRSTSNGKKIDSDKKLEANKLAVGSPKSPGEIVGKGGVKRKVKRFFKISDQESPPKIEANDIFRNLRSRWKITSRNKSGHVSDNISDTDTEVPAADAKIAVDALRMTELDGEVPAENSKIAPDASNTIGSDGKIPMDNVEKMPYVSLMVEEHIVRSNKQKFAQNVTVEDVTDVYFAEMDTSPPESSLYGLVVTVENTDRFSFDNFQVQELSPDEEESEAIAQALDSKIHLWSNGRKGNIRSLLSTLQLVLWPESGWKPIPLVDMIEPNAVKKAYNRAMLCLHPDKLQQKGVSLCEKYMAEKIFGILQEAWDHFNSLGTLL